LGKIEQHFKPNFFIPGAAKSGTTSLHELLDTHPDISMSNEKEPVYWNHKLFNKFENQEISRYLNLFKQDVKIKGESTTSYMYYESFIRNVKNNFQQSPKFIFILRNPIDRYVSHSNWLRGLGKEKRRIDEIIEDERYLDFEEYEDYPKQYYQFGLYNKWISRFVENFGRENIKIVTFEKFVSERLNILNSCFEFLGVSRMQSVKFIKSNKTNKIIFPTIYHFLRKSSIGKMKYTMIGKFFLPKKIRTIIKSLIKIVIKNWISFESKKEIVSNKYRKMLKDIYYEDVMALKDKLNYDFPEWEDFKN
tara:strand:- start:1723 stop:2640 length:918 start_codon:yes stop_codon:yes gene_type:complete